MNDGTSAAALAALRDLNLSLSDIRTVAARAMAERLVPALLALDDSQLRQVLTKALADSNGCSWSPCQEQRRYLGVAGPAPKRDRQAWRHRAVAPSLPGRTAGPTAREYGWLIFESDCPACGVALSGDNADVHCPACDASAVLSRRH